MNTPIRDKQENPDSWGYSWLKGMAIVFSVIVAYIVSQIQYGLISKVVFVHEEILLHELKGEFDSRDQNSLINEWIKIDTVSEQNSLWLKWTGVELGEEPSQWNALLEGESEEEQLLRLQSKIEELEKLKEKGWQTVDGKRLTIMPEEVLLLRRPERIEELKNDLQRLETQRSIYTVISGFAGFVFVWIAYAVIKRVSLFLF